MTIRIGVIGGSGLYEMAELTDREDVRLDTPFGPPSSAYVVGTLAGERVAFLARHGPGHRILPSELNFRANIYGFKVLGFERILSASAVGSLKEEYKPLVTAHARFLTDNRGRRAVIQGNTDERGSREYNLALGQRRADSVKKMMMLLGASDKQIETVSFGEEKPVEMGSNETAWAKNRRADILYDNE